MSSYFVLQRLICEVFCLEASVVHVRICLRLSVSPQTKGQVMSVYIPLKSLFMPLTVLVLSLNNRFLLSSSWLVKSSIAELRLALFLVISTPSSNTA